MIKGIARNLDGLGRATLPIEYRKSLEIKSGEPVDMYLDGKIIRIRNAVKPNRGIVRNLDYLGRVVLPKEYRKYLNLPGGELVDMYLDGEEVCICRAGVQCVICGSTEEDKLVEKNGVHICSKCVFDLVSSTKEV